MRRACRTAFAVDCGVSPFSSATATASRRRPGDDLARLRDRVVLIAGDDELQCCCGRIVARHRRHRIDAGGLERGDRAAAGAVVCGYNADDLFAEARDLAGCPLLGLRRRPVRRVVFREQRVAAVVDAGVDAFLDEAGGGVGRGAVDLQQTGIPCMATLVAFRCSTSDCAIALPMPSLSKDT